jgi:polyhydroxyalkanoate synthesis regulator phasin
MATRDDRNVFQRLREAGEGQMSRVLEELMSSRSFTDLLGKTVEQAMATKGTVDRNMQTILDLLSIPSKADYKKLTTKVEALQGSLVNLNIKLDRILAQQQTRVTSPPRAKAKPKRIGAPNSTGGAR